jgi:redox-sensitive bicupin YhaK (pirin superfamily)
MSNTALIIDERSRDIGDFLVGRLLPFRKKRMVGPFIFIDHMGPETVGNGKYIDVDRHPHIGLCTLTFLLEGGIMHRDSLGTEQLITPGSVNLMVAGSGVTHTERTPEEWRDGPTHTLNGYQIWIALPKSHESTAPLFQHVGADELPAWTDNGAHFKLIAGKAFNRISPVITYSLLFMLEVTTPNETVLDFGGKLPGEVGITVVRGAIHACEERIPEGNMLVAKSEDTCRITAEAGTHLLLFGGEPLPEERHIYWNFVGSSREAIEKAKSDWEADRFPSIPGDTSYVPLP